MRHIDHSKARAALMLALASACAEDVVAKPPAHVVELSTSGHVTCARASDQRAKCWGRGRWAQHGVQTTEALGHEQPVSAIPFLPLGARVEQISASTMSVCALLEGRRSFRCWGGVPPNGSGAWGYPFHGILGDDEPITDGELISVSSTIEVIYVAGLHTCILLDGGAVKCFGANGYGQLGYGHTDWLCDEASETVDGLPSVDIGGPVAQLAMADNSLSCVRMVDGTVKCWGRNAAGMLGQNYPESIGDDDVPADYPPIQLAGEPVVGLSASRLSVCAVHADGALSCWGYVSPALGYGTAVGGVGEYLGDYETPASVGHVDVGGKVTQVAAGEYHTCAVLDDGGVKCWGAGHLVALGYGNTETIGDDESPAAVEPLELGGPAESVHVGKTHSCAVLRSGQVKCWGSPAAALGYGNGEAPIGDDESLAGLPAVDLW